MFLFLGRFWPLQSRTLLLALLNHTWPTANVFTTCCNLTDVANTNSPRAHDPFTPHPPHTFQQEWLGSRDVVTLGTNCAHKEHHSEKCDLMNTKLPDEFRDITLPAAYVLQHTESPLAVMFSGTVAILTNALHVCVTGSSWMYEARKLASTRLQQTCARIS